MTEITAQSIDEALRKQLDALNTSVESREVGTVIQIGDGIARIDGLKDAMAGELLEFIGRGRQDRLRSGPEPRRRRSGRRASWATSRQSRRTTRSARPAVSWKSRRAREMLGRVVNPLGMPIDGKGPIKAEGMRPVEFKAPGVISRKPVHEPMQTGILAIDSMIPIGRGQRELIIGDRQTGKTAIAVDAIINQKGKDMICIYVAVGQKASTVASVVETLEPLRRHGVHHRRHRPPRPTPRRCSTSLPWRVPPSASSSCTTARTASRLPPRTPAATCCASTTTCPSRPWPTARCR